MSDILSSVAVKVTIITTETVIVRETELNSLFLFVLYCFSFKMDFMHPAICKVVLV